jgi:hypothetical protein
VIDPIMQRRCEVFMAAAGPACPNRATHEALGTAYCCDHFNHDWPEQRLINGRECEFERVEVPVMAPEPRWRWQRKPEEPARAGQADSERMFVSAREQRDTALGAEPS